MEAMNRILGIITPVTVLGAGLFFAIFLHWFKTHTDSFFYIYRKHKCLLICFSYGSF